jgi:hypothetical protein
MDDETILTQKQRFQSLGDKPMHFVQSNDDAVVVSEPMRIQISIYSMEGIRRYKVANQLSSAQNQKRFFAKKNLKNSNVSAPITALISVRGELIKTVVPSIPLIFHDVRQGEKSVRGMAFWQDELSGELVKHKDEIPPSTFELSRTMKRQCFHPAAKIGRVSHYNPVKIDLVIGVGRGTNICSLGTSSVVVSGEEEGEYLTNIPIKTLLGRTEKKRGKVRRQIASYHDGNSYIYTLDSNAMLRVGIRVIPQNNYIPKTMTILSAEEMPMVENEDNIYIELNDENSLIAQFKESEQNELLNNKGGQPHYLNDSGYSLFLCGAISCFSVQPVGTMSRPESKISEAKVLSVRAMSDVSGSTIRWQSRLESKYEM